MKTNFFENLKKTNIENITVSVNFNSDNTVTIITSTNPRISKDDALNSLKPIIFTSTIEIADAEFFKTIGEELNKRQRLYSNIEFIEKDREDKATQTKVIKAKNETYKKELEKLENLIKDQTFDARKQECRKKAEKMIKELLDFKPKCSRTLEIKKIIIDTAGHGGLF
ncbi:hypothetical protein [Tenacibaculum ovolyticum]|uniref:hypothetical protein n=1 Tax=Tenacibaculum ovolyticum TaxID=104270 RepID=UPI0007EC9637|nr:hypothetical protein [Tenacibaculum ovolyticum]